MKGEFKMENFTCKLGSIGAKPQSYHIVVPKYIIKRNKLKKGDIIVMAFIGFGDKTNYPFVDGERPTVDIALNEEIEKAKKIGISEDIILKAKEEARYLCSMLNKHQRALTLNSSVAAVAIYVAAVNNGNRATQARLARFYGITEVTIRNQLHKAWQWNNSYNGLARTNSFSVNIKKEAEK